jgi:heme exporter protein B
VTRGLRLFLSFLKWDLVRELRRREVVLNMSLFAVLILFVAQVGLGANRQAVDSVAPVLFWVAVVFTGTIGLSQSFLAEREGARLAGLQLAPIDLGIFYLAKVAAVWIYVMAMEILLAAAYIVFFNFTRWSLLAPLVLVMAVFSLGYVGAGVVLSSMTTALRGGGEIVLRILLVPVMLPVVFLTLQVSGTVFAAQIAGGVLGPPLGVGPYVAVVAAIDAIYVTTGYLVFPKILED